jgi:pimeloyl-[acyl-carrier protein] synthase
MPTAVPSGEVGANDAPSGSHPDPYAFYRWLRENDPVRFDARAGVWLVSRHADCVAVLRDRRCSSALGQARRRREDRLPSSMLTTDPPEHERLRRPAGALFGDRGLAPLRARMAAVVGALADAAARRGGMDAIADYGDPVALDALATLIGVPSEDRPAFADLARRVAVNLDPLAGADKAALGRAAAGELADHLAGLVDRAPAGGQGAVSALLRRQGDGRSASLGRDDLLSTLVLLVVGGYEPTVHLIGNGLLTLLRWPEELTRLRREARLLTSAVDELLRWESPIPFTARVCVEEVELGGRRLAAGDTVVALLAAANRDPAVFGDPERLDLARSPNPMLAFGSGIHTCIAAPLAKMVGRLAIGTIVARFAEVSLAGDASWRPGLVPRGLARLPLRLVPNNPS